jgi:hypothetical protein
VVLRVLPSPYGSGIFSGSSAERLSVAQLVFQGLQNLLDRIERMRELGPEFIDVTWCVRSTTVEFLIRALTLYDRNAGGRTSDLTTEMVKTCQSTIGIETCMHLTCTNMPAEKVDIALRVRVFFSPFVKRSVYFLGSEAVGLP